MKWWGLLSGALLVMMKKVFLLPVLLVTGCWLLPLPQTVEVRLPEVPLGWTETEIFFSLRYPGDHGAVQWKRDLHPGGVASISLERGSPVPVAAYPHFSHLPAPVPGMRCAGGIYPFDGGREEPLRLTWKDGFLAELLLRLSPEGRAPLNIGRLREGITEAARGDPWGLDGERLIGALVFHRFTSSTLKNAPLYPWPLPSGRETWWWGDPLLDGADWGDPPEGPPPPGVVRLYPGIHRLTAPGGEEGLSLEITEEGWRGVEHPGGEGCSGEWD